MKKLLIVDSSELFAESLVAFLHEKFNIRICTDSNRVVQELETYHPDFLVINIHLPVCDGITLLRRSSHRPPHILALLLNPSPYTLQALMDLGAEHVLMLPCAARAVAEHIDDMLRFSLLTPKQRNLQDMIRQHLRILGFMDGEAGFPQLCTAVPLFAQDPYQSLSKELEPAVAQLCGNNNGKQVESQIRRLITLVWKSRNCAVWSEYFPDLHEKPTIHEFLCLLCDKLDLFRGLMQLAQNE